MEAKKHPCTFKHQKMEIQKWLNFFLTLKLLGKPHWSNLEVILWIQTRHDNAERKNIRSLLNSKRHDFSFECAKNGIIEHLSNKWRTDKNKSSSLRLEARLHLIYLGINTMCRTNAVFMHNSMNLGMYEKHEQKNLRVYEPPTMP